jgi:phenylpyruvate tautomerase PptA (4-oxalocrotonate tautomerase family)
VWGRFQHARRLKEKAAEIERVVKTVPGTQHSPGNSVSVVISRAKDEEWTHIDWECYEAD